MKVLCIGDVVGRPGVDLLKRLLPNLKTDTGADFVIVNGENSDASGVGINRATAEEILQYADVITTGNHCFRKAGEDLFSDIDGLLCPGNYPGSGDNSGCYLVDMGRYGSLQVINLLGVAFMEPLDNPFYKVDRCLKKTRPVLPLWIFMRRQLQKKRPWHFT